MRDRPSGSELLREARRVLREELADELEGEQRFKALMAANAMAMAMRELDEGDRPLRREFGALTRLLGQTPASEQDMASLVAALRELNQRLARDIREGRWDGTEEVHSALIDETRDRVKESNPKALENSV
ncbi:MAG: DUF6285 domain-containing protein [Rhodovibrionaceae bacterium]|nr:DUF6285 domain-containing protein [Rhodovibrionaceae bacterium]